MKLTGSIILATLLIASSASAATPWINGVRWLKSCTILEVKGRCSIGDTMGIIIDSCDQDAGGYTHIIHRFKCGGPYFKQYIKREVPAGDSIFIRSLEKGCDEGGGIVVPPCNR